ncbi:MAG TPA: hypothetical protein VKB51_19190 [bacterium]|nr:hypothetical protein [bacterium]
MKLKVTDWRQAWFESHISDRFFQEMSRVEKGTVHGLEHTAQWMEQIMIEVGVLAQAMLRLEQDGAPEPQIKLAYEKALRLAALSLHLITALDNTDRAQLHSASIVRSEPAEWTPSRQVLAAAQATPPAAPVPQTVAAQAAPTPGGPPPHPFTHGTAALRPPIGPAREREPAAPAASPQPAEPVAPADAAPDAPLFTSLLQVSGSNAPRSENQMRETIVSLSLQGLSRAEIEMVTGEPRHVVEAVLNHARDQARAAAQPT